MNNRLVPPSHAAEVAVGFERSKSFYTGSAKRGLDLFLCALMLPILLPIIAVLYVLVRSSGGPGFFGHKRVGKNGRTFRCWKLRTMVPDAEAKLEALLSSDAAARAEWERDRKLRCDPRITKLGDFLRKTSLDELPQIFNVVKGEMSLVGPRPVTEDEIEKYGVHKRTYLAMRPGISGLWQVSGRNDISYSERVSLDRSYFRNASLTLDISILLKTINVVLRKTGL